MAELPFVSITTRINNHHENIIGSWKTNAPSNLLPVSVEIHLTDNCNANCPFCFYASGNNNCSIKLSNKVLMELCSDLIKSNVKSIVLSGGGEPTIHPDFSTVVKILSSSGIEVGVITNGIHLNADIIEAFHLCKWVKYSVHTYLPDLYAKMMGRDGNTLYKVQKNIRSITGDISKSVNISVGSVITYVNDSDEHIVEFFKYCAGELNADYVLYKPVIGNRLQDQPSQRSRDEFRRLAPIIRRLSEQTGIYSNYHTFVRDFGKVREVFIGKCPIVWDGLIALIDANADVYGCLPIMQLYDKSNRFGNLYENSFSNVWSSSIRKHWLLAMDDKNCPDCKYERMFSVMEKIVANKGQDNPKLSPDQHWKFL